MFPCVIYVFLLLLVASHLRDWPHHETKYNTKSEYLREWAKKKNVNTFPAFFCLFNYSMTSVYPEESLVMQFHLPVSRWQPEPRERARHAFLF